MTDDGSPRAPLTFALWEPPLLHTYAEVRARRPATSEAADLLAALVKAEVPALAFIRSRRGAETVALAARDALGEELSGNVAAYRSGYLADDRRGLEAGLRDGRITGMATTTALELGINITGLDAVLIAGWPGTWASLWQQAGRAGRAGHARHRGVHRPRRPARQLPGAPPGHAARTIRSSLPCSTRPTRTCSARTWPRPRPSCR